KKYVYHIADFYADSRGGYPNFIKKIIRKFEYIVINRAEVTIICTEDRVKQIEGSKPKKLVIVHNTPIVSDEIINSAKRNIEEHKNKESLTFTYVGGLTERRFIKSVINVIKKYPRVTLNIAGMGKLNDFVQKASVENENINFLGMIDYKDALNLYSS